MFLVGPTAPKIFEEHCRISQTIQSRHVFTPFSLTTLAPRCFYPHQHKSFRISTLHQVSTSKSLHENTNNLSSNSPISVCFESRIMVEHWIETGDLWKGKARSLQLLLRDRFRVAVDRHRQHRRFSSDDDGDGYFSSTIQRCLERFRHFRRDSLPSSSTFYRKTGQAPFFLV